MEGRGERALVKLTHFSPYKPAWWPPRDRMASCRSPSFFTTALPLPSYAHLLPDYWSVQLAFASANHSGLLLSPSS